MLTFLSAPMGLSDALRVGPVRRQSDWLVEMLRDPARSRIHLVALPEEMPVSETIETSEAITHKIGLNPGAVFANAVYQPLLTTAEATALDEVMSDKNPRELRIRAAEVGLRLDGEDLKALVGYARFLEARRGIQTKHLRALKKGVEDPVLELPFLFSAGLALPDIETLADVVEEKVAAL